jgi:hypothetical protein
MTERAKALRIVQEELKRLGWAKAELKRRRKGDQAKVTLARRLEEGNRVCDSGSSGKRLMGIDRKLRWFIE